MAAAVQGRCGERILIVPQAPSLHNHKQPTQTIYYSNSAKMMQFSSRTAHHSSLLSGALSRTSTAYTTELKTRLLCWVFGMTVIGQLWLWPIYAFVASQSLLFCVLLAT